MPLYQPSNIIPSMLGAFGDGVVVATYPSATNYTTFSWRVNGGEPMTAFRIAIFENDENKTLAWQSPKLTTGCPFYPADANGNPQMFTYTIPYADLHDPVSPATGAGMRAGKEYIMYIKQYWGSSTEAESLITVSPAAFITRGKGTIALSVSSGAVLTGRTQTITATYTQYSGQNDDIIRVRWQLWDSQNSIVKDTGWVNTSLLSFTYNGFAYGESYYVQCSLQTETGLAVSGAKVGFSIKDATAIWYGEPRACAIPYVNGVLLQWNEPYYIPASINNPPVYRNETDNDLLLMEGQTIEWDTVNSSQMALTFPLQGIWEGYITGFPLKAFTLSFADGSTHSIIVDENDNFGGSKPEIGDKVVVKINIESKYRGSFVTELYGGGGSGKYKLSESGNIIRILDADEGTFQSLVLDGNDKLTAVYPTKWKNLSNMPLKGWIVSTYSRTPLNPSGDVTAISMEGPQDNHYFWLTNGSAKTIGQIPSWEDIGTVFLVSPVSGVQNNNAGNVASSTVYNGADVYRSKPGSTRYEYVGSADVDQTGLIDVSAKSQTMYQYSVFLRGTDLYEPNAVDISPCFWDWVLYACQNNGDGSYTPTQIFRFRYNVESGSMSNSSSPSVMANFTRYPTVILPSSNYKSGALTGYIGVSQHGQYSDTVAQRDALFELSTSPNTVLYLKNRKGDFIRVMLSAPVSAATADNTREQAQNISVSWVEVGYANEDRVILTSNDDLYKTTSI